MLFTPPFFINIIFEGNEMLKKLKMTTFAAVLGLFGFVLVPAAPVFAEPLTMQQAAAMQKADYNKCVRKGKRFKLECFKKLAAKMIYSRGKVCSSYKDVKTMINTYNPKLNFCG